MRTYGSFLVTALFLAVPATAESRDGGGVSTFWSWFEKSKPRLEAGLTKGTIFSDTAFRDEISKAVATVHPGLTWEVGGVTGDFDFIVSPDGSSVLRRYSERWLKTAPKVKGWRFFAAKQAKPEALGQLIEASTKGKGGEYAIKSEPTKADDKAAAAFLIGTEVDDATGRVHVEIFHPAFSTLPEQERKYLCFVALDLLLGEDAVMRWIGAVDATTKKPQGAKTAGEFVALVKELPKSLDEEHVAIAKGKVDGREWIITYPQRLKRIDYLEFDQHLEVRFPLAKNADGVAGPAQVEEAQDLFDRLATGLEPVAVEYAHLLALDKSEAVMRFYAADRDAADAKLNELLKSPKPKMVVTRKWSTDEEWSARDKLLFE